VAMLTIESARPSSDFAIVPFSVRSSRVDSAWAVPARAYRVALTADTLYKICSLPCLMPDSVSLRPGTKVTKRY